MTLMPPEFLLSVQNVHKEDSEIQISLNICHENIWFKIHAYLYSVEMNLNSENLVDVLHANSRSRYFVF